MRSLAQEPAWSKHYPVTRTEAEWRKLLTPEQYAIMREHGTEAPGSCALNFEKRAGTFMLRRLRSAAVRLQEEIRESARGRPSFNDPVQARWKPSEDDSYGMVRTEVQLQPLRQPSGPRVRRRPDRRPACATASTAWP